MTSDTFVSETMHTSCESHSLQTSKLTLSQMLNADKDRRLKVRARGCMDFWFVSAPCVSGGIRGLMDMSPSGHLHEKTALKQGKLGFKESPLFYYSWGRWHALPLGCLLQGHLKTGPVKSHGDLAYRDTVGLWRR